MKVSSITAVSTLLIALSLFVMLSLAFAAVPQTINYQGYLKDSTGSPVSKPTNMTFSLYSTTSGVGAVWSSTSPTNGYRMNVTPVNGVYSVELGASPQPALPSFERKYWLGIQVADDPEMSLQPLSSVPYALAAAKVADGSITTSSLSINCGEGQVLIKTLTDWECGRACTVNHACLSGACI
jgi:hypothetical protein